MISTIRRRRRAAPGPFTGLLTVLVTRLDTWAELRRQRRALAVLSDAMLRDIGLGRGDVEREASRPFWDVPEGRPSRWR